MVHPPYRRKKTSKNKWKKFIDTATYTIAIIGPIAGLPQLLKIWIHKDATSVSALSWAAFTSLSVIWLLHGITNKDKPLIINSTIWIALALIITIGTLIYS